MPEVTFTPRVSVRRMCTPSRMLFAARVFFTSAMIASWLGISAKAIARAEGAEAVEVLDQAEDPAAVDA
ncbi:MAG: hypothetical protein U0835_25885 [Isosphaeraceae bacterium]